MPVKYTRDAGIRYTGNKDDLRQSTSNAAGVLDAVQWRHGDKQGEATILTPEARQANDATACSDAGWAGDTDTRRSMCSSLVKMAGGPVAWRVSKSTAVSPSTTNSTTHFAHAYCTREKHSENFLRLSSTTRT